MKERTNTRLILTALVALLLVPATTSANTLAPETRLTASDGASRDQFGHAIAIEGETVVVTSPLDDPRGTDSGSAYVFERIAGEWVQTHKLVPSDGAPRDFFGQAAVELAGTTLIIGANRDDDFGYNSGSVYVFERTSEGWVQVQKLRPRASGSSYSRFGFGAALDGDTLAIAAFHDRVRGYESGAAYVFRFDGSQWNEEQKLVPGDGQRGDQFGRAIAHAGDIVAVGAPYNHDLGNDTGKAYIFRFDGAQWVEEQTLFPVAPVARENFGIGMCARSDFVFVSSRQGYYVYRRTASGWIEHQRLEPGFLRCSVENDRLVIGSQADDGSAGAVHVYHLDGANWVEGQRLTAESPAAGDYLGVDVDISGQRVVAGAVQESTGPGFAYVFGPANAPPDVTCNAPTASAGTETCSATVDCETIASCTDPDDDTTTVSCDPADPYGLGPTDVLFTCDDGQTSTSVTCSVTVEDTTPPDVLAPDPLTLTCTRASVAGSGEVPATEPQIVDWLASASAVDVCDATSTVTDDAPAIFGMGTTPVTFEGTDADNNIGQGESSVQVTYHFGGFLPPIRNDNSTSIKQSKAGRTIPVKLRLYCGGEPNDSAVATISVYKLLDIDTGSVDQTDLTEDAGSSNDNDSLFRYDPVDDLYIYNLSTKGYDAPATYRIFVDLNDGTQLSADFSLRP